MGEGEFGAGAGPKGRNANHPESNGKASIGARRPDRFAALDLGTNNCRLLIAAPSRKSFRVVDAFSRIVRLGEGLSQTGKLSGAATDRAIEALKICSEKIAKRNVTRMRCIATQACRGASNGQDFLDRVYEETGLTLEIITPEEEARLAVRGCAELLDTDAPAGLIFDIGGGSTELSWVSSGTYGARPKVHAWTSIPIGVVNLSEHWGGKEISEQTYGDIVEEVRKEIASLGDPGGVRSKFEDGKAHFLGTSGTVTSIAGVHLELPRYRRDRVDGLWLTTGDVGAVTQKLRAMTFMQRAEEPCIGKERADLVVCGCAILEALLQEWPVTRVRVADRGLREGILSDLAELSRRARRRRKRRRKIHA